MSENTEFGKPGRLSDGLSSFSTPSAPSYKGTETKEEINARLSRKRDMSKISVTPARPDMDPFDTGRMKRVVVYCRVSSDKLEQESSLVTQKNYYMGYVEKRPDMELKAIYLDEGISATGIQKRKGLIRLLRDAKEGKFDIIIVKNLSRLSRNLMDCMQIIYMLRRLPNPVGILFERENMFTLDKNIDFTLQILALVAQEESHKKSEAVTGAQRQRYEMGQFMKFDLLGYDRVGVNEIAINPEEARTVQLIFMMYMAGCDPEMIADVLNMLGRRKHTHRYKDGRVKEGKVDWTKTSVVNVLGNEKRCGHVDAQKTVTENYLDHKAVKNSGQAPRYYAIDQHPAIIDPVEFALVQKMVASNRGGWSGGLQQLGIYTEGLLAGGVSAVPDWYGFGAEDYNRACLRAHGIEEATLEDIENRINKKDEQEQQQEDNSAKEVEDLPEMMEIQPVDYDNYLEQKIEEDLAPEEEQNEESFRKWVEMLREKENKKNSDQGIDTLSNIEYGCAELFSLNEKVCITLDYRGATFNKFSFRRMNEDVDGAIMNVELIYNPLEQMLFVREAKEQNPTTINWAKEDSDGKYSMKRCCTKGLSASIFKNMGWNTDFKYRIVGRAVEFEGETVLAFFLDRTIRNVPVKQYSPEDAELGKVDKKKAKRMFKDGFIPDDIVLPDLEEFNLGDGPMANQVKNMSRSDAIYFDKSTSKEETKLTLEDLGDDKYSPDRIRYMLQRGLSPAEGWSYLQGMAVIGKNRFTILSEDLADHLGDSSSKRRDNRLKEYMDRKKGSSMTTTPYGWTVGLTLPTMEKVNEVIEYLKQEMAAG